MNEAAHLFDEVVDPDLLLGRHEEEGFGPVELDALHLSLTWLRGNHKTGAGQQGEGEARKKG